MVSQASGAAGSHWEMPLTWDAARRGGLSERIYGRYIQSEIHHHGEGVAIAEGESGQFRFAHPGAALEPSGGSEPEGIIEYDDLHDSHELGDGWMWGREVEGLEAQSLVPLVPKKIDLPCDCRTVQGVRLADDGAVGNCNPRERNSGSGSMIILWTETICVGTGCERLYRYEETATGKTWRWSKELFEETFGPGMNTDGPAMDHPPDADETLDPSERMRRFSEIQHIHSRVSDQTRFVLRMHWYEGNWMGVPEPGHVWVEVKDRQAARGTRRNPATGYGFYPKWPLLASEGEIRLDTAWPDRTLEFPVWNEWDYEAALDYIDKTMRELAEGGESEWEYWSSESNNCTHWAESVLHAAFPPFGHTSAGSPLDTVIAEVPNGPPPFGSTDRQYPEPYWDRNKFMPQSRWRGKADTDISPQEKIRRGMPTEREKTVSPAQVEAAVELARAVQDYEKAKAAVRVVRAILGR